MPRQNAPIFDEASETKQVKSDLIRVILLNGIFFGLLIVLYFWNRSTGQMDVFFQKLLNF